MDSETVSLPRMQALGRFVHDAGRVHCSAFADFCRLPGAAHQIFVKGGVEWTD